MGFSPFQHLSSIALEIKNTFKLKALSPLTILVIRMFKRKNLVGTHTQSSNYLYQAPVHAFLSFSSCPYSHVLNKQDIRNTQKY